MTRLRDTHTAVALGQYAPPAPFPSPPPAPAPRPWIGLDFGPGTPAGGNITSAPRSDVPGPDPFHGADPYG